MGEHMSDDIHSDGTVELITRWRPGGAQGAPTDGLIDGESYLVVYRDSKGRSLPARWTSTFIANHPVWWKQVEWWLPCSEIDLPVVEGRK